MPRGDAIDLWVAAAALKLMVNAADQWTPDETGGVLVGYWAEQRQVVVTAAVDAGPHSTHSTDGFHPDSAYQVAKIAELYEASGRYHLYLGDWHTHPLGGLGLSRIDRQTMRRIARTSAARCPRPLMLVLASADNWQLAAWSPERRWGRLLPVPATIRTFG